MEHNEIEAVQAAQKAILAAKRKARLCYILAAIVVIGAVAVIMATKNHQKEQIPNMTVVSAPTLQKIVNVNELSTFTAVYNGVASVPSKENPDEIDYYVSYEAKVNVGIDVKKISISVDQEKKVITIILPEVNITDINVKSSSLDFIFVNEEANTNTVVAEAYKICEEDVQNESEKETDIKTLAKQNAINIMTALTKPFIEQLDIEYTLVIQ